MWTSVGPCRKAFFILVITKFNKSFMKTQESLARGGIKNKHSPDVKSPSPPPRVCMSIHPDARICSDLGSRTGLSLIVLLGLAPSLSPYEHSPGTYVML
jgi:hypothetical protein